MSKSRLISHIFKPYPLATLCNTVPTSAHRHPHSMGYTQYWRVKEDLPDFDEFAAIVMKIVSPYDVNGTRVFSNAVGKILVKGNSVKITGTYEPFCFHNKKQDFAFCKTAREPYDKYVTAILTAALFLSLIHI